MKVQQPITILHNHISLWTNGNESNITVTFSPSLGSRRH